MDKVTGIDISKKTFDASFLNKMKKWEHKVFKNDLTGFKQLIKWSPMESSFVMEASGPYYIQLASFLFEKRLSVFVANPLAIRRYSQMKMYRAKTDKKDASTIAEYGSQEVLRKWKPKSKVLRSIQQIYTALELLKKQRHMTNRQLESFELNIENKILIKDLKGLVNKINRLIDKQEEVIKKLVEIEYKLTMDLLTSIPGIGEKSAALLITATDNLENFDNYKQLIAYVGFSPRIYQSGTSVKGRGGICKLGKPQLRKALYLCSWSAKRCNKTCIEMYERLKAKGKPERVIKVAIANKLIKQAFAVVKSKNRYNKNYTKILAS
jgi:transposase